MKFFQILSGAAGSVAMFFFNYGFLENLIIPDPCYYHGKGKTNWLFDFFYNLESSDGYHPFPSGFNLILILGLGFLVGWFAFSWFRRILKPEYVQING